MPGHRAGLEKGRNMHKFEYRILQASDLSENVLNELGKEGWELVCSTLSIVYGSCLVLKREKNE